VSLHDAHVPTREEIVRATARPIPAIYKTVSLLLAALGTVLFIYGAFIGEQRAWLSLHFNWLFFTIISSAAVAFTAVQRLTTARWSRPVIRFIEGYVAFLPVAFVILLVILFFGDHHIFSWARETVSVPEKAKYLDPLFFKARGVLIFGAITLISLWYIYTSVRLDVGITPESGASWARGLRDRMRRGFGEERRELHSTHSLQGKIAVVLCLLFGFGWTVLAWDYSMTLSLHFQSTMYGWQVFMGGWVVMLMTFSMMLFWWRKHLNVPDLVTENHFHDVGKLCFAFTAFWGYLTFSQYLVIWYANLGEETHFMRLRLLDPWVGLTTAVAVMMFIIPFFGLLSKSAKMWAPTMGFFAFSSIIGLWIHRYIEIYPSVYGEAASLPFGIWEIGIGLGMLGLWGLSYISFMDAFPRMRVFLMTSPYRDEVQVPVDPKTMEPLPAHE
jgi:hypothetical protein